MDMQLQFKACNIYKTDYLMSVLVKCNNFVE